MQKKRVKNSLVRKIVSSFLAIIMLFINSGTTILSLAANESNGNEGISPLSVNIGDTSGLILLQDREGRGSQELQGEQILEANEVYYAYIAGGRGGDDTYFGGNGGYQKIKITVGSQDVTLSYKVGGQGKYGAYDETDAGWPDGQAGLGSGGGGGSTSLYINGTPISAAAGGGGGGQKSPGLGGTATGGTGTGGVGEQGINGVTITHNGTNGQLWYNDCDSSGGEGIPHYKCDADGGGGGGGFPVGLNSYYHESGWHGEELYRANFDKLNLDGRYINNTWNFALDESQGPGWGTVGDYGGTGGQGFIREGSVQGCTIELLQGINGANGIEDPKIPDESTPDENDTLPGSVVMQDYDGNCGEGFFKLYREPYKVKFNITKVDSITGEKLSGAVFGVYEYTIEGYKRIDQLTETSPGVYTSNEISETDTNNGMFRVVEESAPGMYVNSGWSKDVVLSQRGVTTITETVSNEPYKIKAKIIKKDSETKNDLVGAKFNVYVWNSASNSYQQYVVDGHDVTLIRQSNGTYQTYDWLYYSPSNQGKYRVIETTTPTGYVGDYSNIGTKEKKVYDINVTSQNNNQVVTISNSSDGTFLNTRVKGKINVSIIDSETRRQLAQGDATLQGAVYGLYARENIVHADGKTGVLYEKDELVATGTIQDFKMTFENLELGKYYIKQITPSEGYKNDTREYDVDLAYVDDTVTLVEKDVVVEEEVKKQAFQLIKVGEDGDNTELELLEGAGFKIYLISSLEGVKNGQITPNPDGTYNYSSFIGYDFTNEQTALDYSNNQDGENIAEQFTDKKGFMQSPELAYGQYVVIESTTPEEHITINPFTVNVKEDNREPQTWRVFLDKEFKAKVNVIKKDNTSNLAVLNKNAQYRIYNKTENTYVEQWITYPDRILLGSEEHPFETNDKGEFTTPFVLEPGDYELQEVTAPEGYVLTGYEGYSENGVYTATPKNSVTFKISNNSAFQVDPNTNEAIVIVEQYNDRQVGSLTITAEGEYLNDAAKNDNGYDFSYTNRPIEGAIFEIYAKEDIMSPDNQGTVIYEKDEKITTVTTNQEGKVIVDNLPLGKYYIKEIVAGEGFALNQEQKEFEMAYGGQEVAVVYQEVNYENPRQTVKVVINKKDEETGNAIVGAIFGLYLKEDLTYTNAEGQQVTINANELVETEVSQADGKITFDNNLPLANYYIKEIQAPAGYATDNTQIDIKATYEDDQKSEILREIDFVNKKTTVKILVKDFETDVPLTEMGLVLKDNEGREIQTWVTKENGEYVIKGLEAGKEYTLVENSIKYGYTENVLIKVEPDENELEKREIEDEQIVFTVKDTANEQKVTIYNRAKVSDINVILQGEILVATREDENGNKEFIYEMGTLADGEFEIYAKEDIIHPDGKTGVIINKDTKIASLITDKEGKLIIKVDESIINAETEEIRDLLERGIPLGKYEVRQTKAPKGYHRNPDDSIKELNIVYENPIDEVQHAEIIFENIRQRVNLGKKHSSVEILKEADKEIYKTGETANYTITVKNNGEVLLRNVEVTETMIDGKFLDKEGITVLENNKVNIPELAVGESIELTYQYTIPDGTEGRVENKVTVTGTPVLITTDEDGEPIEEELPPVYDDEVEEILVTDGDILITKEADNSKYLLGETIRYTVKVLNPTEYEIVDVILTDSLEGIQFEEKEGMTVNTDGTVTIDRIEPGSTFELTYTYVIPEDFLENKIENTIKGTGTLIIVDPENPDDIEEQPVEDEANEDVEVGKARLKVTKTAENAIYKVGEKVLYTIEVINDGNVKIRNLKVSDSLEGGIFQKQEGITIQDGVVSIDELDVGETITLYYEYVVPEGKINGEKIPNTVTVTGEGIIEDEENPDNPPTIEELEETADEEIIVDEKNSQEAKAGITKLDIETKEPLAGAVFDLYTRDDIVVEGQVIIPKDTFIERAVSGQDGLAQFKADLTLGNYYIIEVEPPKGYEKNDDPVEIEASELDESEIVINVYKQKENYATRIDISKVEVGKTEEIIGAKLQILDENENVIESWVTNGTPHIVRGLETNKTYYLDEAEPAPGYVTAERIEFSMDDYGNIQTSQENINPDAETQTIVMRDDITRLEVSVIDIETKEPVIGAEMEIVDKETGEVIETWITDGTIHVVEKLPIGDYELVQTKAPTEQGYVKPDNIDFEIQDTSEVHEVIMEEDFTKLEVSLVDKDTQELLPGGILEIINENGEVVATIDDTSNKFYIERLPVGNYTLVETKTPDGYNTADPINFELKETSEIQTVVMENEKQIFDFRVDKWIEKISINGKEQQGTTIDNKEEMLKIDVGAKKVNTDKIKLIYRIRVSNVGELAGTVGRIVDEIPVGFNFEASENQDYWRIEDNKLVCTAFEQVVLQPGESIDLQVILNWINGDSNFGVKTNIAKIENVTNQYNFEDIDESNNISESNSIFSIRTGLEMILTKHIALVIISALLVISLLVIVEVKIMNRRKNNL